MNGLVLTFPFPDMKLASIHGNGDRFAKARAIKQLRHSSSFFTLEQAGSIKFERAYIRYWFYMRSKIKRDEANMIQACKPIIDGIVDAGVLAGDSWDVLSIAGVITVVDRLNPRVEIELWEGK